MIHVLPLRVQLAFYAFALTFSTSAIKTFSFLAGMPLPTSFYVVGGVLSVLVFSLFFLFMSALISMPAAQE